MQKSRENSMHRFVIELRKLILGIFLSKNLDARFFPKKSLSVYNANFLQKKTQEVSIHWFCAKHKTSLGAYFGYLLGQKLQNKIISKNYLRQFYVYATAISCKNQKRSIHLLLIILEKLYFGPISGPVWPKYFKKSLTSILNFYADVT